MGNAVGLRRFGPWTAIAGAAAVFGLTAMSHATPPPVGNVANEAAARSMWFGRKALLEGDNNSFVAVAAPNAEAPRLEPPPRFARPSASIAREMAARSAWYGRSVVADVKPDPKVKRVQVDPPPLTQDDIPVTPRPPAGGFDFPGGEDLPPGVPRPPAEADRPTGSAGAPVDYIRSLEVYNITDAGSIFSKSPAAIGTYVQRRSAIANDVHIRGYNLSQTITYADGAYWTPARQDLDTFLSKIDSGIIRDVVVVKGPYTSRMGPAFAFIDIQTDPSPRYECGTEWHGRSVVTYDSNGRQFYGRQSILGGDKDWGFRLSYGQRTGNDYETGDGFQIPGSFNARDFELVAGFDLSSCSHLEIGAIRLDQTNLEFPGQIFDTNFLVTQGYRVRYVLEDQGWFDRFVLDGFYNRTALEGNAQRTGKRRQIPVLNEANFIGFTNIDQMSAGGRASMSWGDSSDPMSALLTLGVDYRHLKQEVAENDQIFGLPCATTFGVPRSHMGDFGGLFAEYIVPVNDRLRIQTGARIDYVFYDIDRLSHCDCCGGEVDLSSLLGTDDFSRSHTLFLAYITGEYKVTDTCALTAGFGHAQAPATLTETYANDPFLAILQQGFTTVRGNPGLSPQRLYQADVGMQFKGERARGGVNGFYSWVHDYITYSVIDSGKLLSINLPSEFTNALSVQFVNTDLATLAGGEAYAEVDVTNWLTPFTTVSYVTGRDQTRNGRGVIIRNSDGVPIPGVGAFGADAEPLPMMPPLEARVGIRVHDTCVNRRWAVEFAGHFYAAQDQVASSLLEQPTAGYVIFDLRSYYRPRENVLLTAGIENIFDRDVQNHFDLRTGFGVYQPGLNAYVGVDLRY